MSKEAWFWEFERLEAEHPEKSDSELSEMAREAMIDRQTARVDALCDEAKYEEERGGEGVAGGDGGKGTQKRQT